MSEQDPELEAFSKFIDALDPWLGEVVLVGGWAHRLYRLDARARKLDYLPLTTLDGDVAVPPKLKKEESTVRRRLLAKADPGKTCRNYTGRVKRDLQYQKELVSSIIHPNPLQCLKLLRKIRYS